MAKCFQMLGSLFLVFALALPVTSRAEGGVLMIGDSLSVGRVADNLQPALIKASGHSQVRVVASCGSRPRDWGASRSVYKTDCGYFDLSDRQQRRVTYLSAKSSPQSTPKLSQLMAEEKPSTLVIQQGTNMFWDLDKGEKSMADARTEVNALLDEVFSSKPAPKNCLWVSPPDTSKWPTAAEDRMYYFLNDAIGARCKVFDSRTVTRYPVRADDGADGIHYDQTTKGKPEQDRWAAAIANEVKKMSLLRTQNFDETSKTRISTH